MHTKMYVSNIIITLVCKIGLKIADACYSEVTIGGWLVESGQQVVLFGLYSIFKAF